MVTWTTEQGRAIIIFFNLFIVTLDIYNSLFKNINPTSDIVSSNDRELRHKQLHSRRINYMYFFIHFNNSSKGYNYIPGSVCLRYISIWWFLIPLISFVAPVQSSEIIFYRKIWTKEQRGLAYIRISTPTKSGSCL